MRFWDTSALVPLVAEEPASAACRRLLRSDGDVVVWALTRTEIASAVRRKERARELGREQVRSALRRAALLAARWSEVEALDPIRDRAERLLAVHPLAAADALQLAAALFWAGEPAGRWEMVVADEPLAAAAEAEGLRVSVPPGLAPPR